MNRKAISPVVATALLLVVAVTAVVSFQSWFNTYQSSALLNVEQQSGTSSILKVNGIIGNELYIYSGKDAEFSELKIMDSSGIEVCNISFTQSDTGLVGYWSFNSDATDSSGNGNDGVVSGATLNLSGKYNGAYNFDGIDDYILVPDSPSLRVQNFTIAGWYYKMPKAGIQVLIGKQFGTSTSNSYAIFDGETFDKYSFFGRIGGGTSKIYSTMVMPEESWKYFTVTYNSTNMTLYMDGAYVYSELVTGLISYDSQPISFGADDDSGSDTYSFFFKGTLDEIRIYNRSLSEDEINSLYTSNKLTSSNIESGMNVFDTSSCSLNSGETYNVVGITSSGVLDMKVIAK